eukprot:CAMPEP_0204220166 /NCGR_PEP_ID=MMETSP0361-20130328/80784_1 /ASSEMBLY_ACC=CAM_ASM_000343 /TAXON_ID=268821 /ORGANISM="Scrippsiella Hangoei, Strain SHTV-5" /LENGTH=65 /DNA_ID=CAMNT_0051185535 /DNA_START=41 /DNA_END=235 /DNA_ORIENTATION=-
MAFRNFGLDDLRDDCAARYCTAWMDAHLDLEMVKGRDAFASEGRGSTASQFAHGELAPRDAARKV